MKLKKINMSIDFVRQILGKISFTPSCVDMKWEWEVKECTDGFLIRTTFIRPDIHTGEIGKGFGRWMYVHKDSTEDSIVKTAWLCCELIIKHELMESFLVSGKRIFDPHKTIEELSYYKNEL